MELSEAITSTAATRDFLEDEIPDELIYRILDMARFAPSGGNRQPWRVVIVKDQSIRDEIKELYSQGWREYMGHIEAGLVPFAPIDNGNWIGPAIDLEDAATKTFANSFADNLHKVPVLMVLLAKLGDLAVLDNGLGRQSIVGGGSVYPFGHNILLSARSLGLGGVMTTVLCRREPQVKQLLQIPDELAVAGLIGLGVPKKLITKLRRRKVEEFTYVNRFGSMPFTPPQGSLEEDEDKPS